jgi:hypothetical protein
MKIIKVKKVEDCFDGSVIFEYFFDKKIDENLMRNLARSGTLDFFPEFKRPFFKIMTVNGLQIKGIIGDQNFEVVFPRIKKRERKEKFEDGLRKIL